MAIALVQQKSFALHSDVANTGTDLNLPGAPTSGNMLVLISSNNDNVTGPSMAAQAGVTWTRQNYFRGDASHDNIAIFTGVVGAGASAACQQVFNVGASNYAAFVLEFSGVQQVLDGSVPAPTNLATATPATSSATPTITGDLAVAGISYKTAASPTATPSGWTTITGATDATAPTIGVQGAWKEVTGTSAQSAQWTFAASQNALAELVLIKGLVAAADPTRREYVMSGAVVRGSSY